MSVHFLCLSKENEPKERTTNHSPLRCWPSAARSLYPLEGCCSKRADASESHEVYAPLRGIPPSRFLIFSVLLGCVKRQKKHVNK